MASCRPDAAHGDYGYGGVCEKHALPGTPSENIFRGGCPLFQDGRSTAEVAAHDAYTESFLTLERARQMHFPKGEIAHLEDRYSEACAAYYIEFIKTSAVENRSPSHPPVLSASQRQTAEDHFRAHLQAFILLRLRMGHTTVDSFYEERASDAERNLCVALGTVFGFSATKYLSESTYLGGKQEPIAGQGPSQMTKLTTHSRAMIDQKLAEARKDLAAAMASRDMAQRDVAEQHLSGKKTNPIVADQQEEARLRNVIAGLEQISDEREYFDTRKTIELGVGAIEVGYRTGISDPRMKFRELYARQATLEDKYPDFSARYELSK